MGGRKNRSAVDTVMNLIHDIQHAFHKNHVSTAVLLDVKEAFDHVSKTQLFFLLYHFCMQPKAMTTKLQ